MQTNLRCWEDWAADIVCSVLRCMLKAGSCSTCNPVTWRISISRLMAGFGDSSRKFPIFSLIFHHNSCPLPVSPQFTFIFWVKNTKKIFFFENSNFFPSKKWKKWNGSPFFCEESLAAVCTSHSTVRPPRPQTWFFRSGGSFFRSDRGGKKSFLMRIYFTLYTVHCTLCTYVWQSCSILRHLNVDKLEKFKPTSILDYRFHLNLENFKSGTRITQRNGDVIQLMKDFSWAIITVPK